MYTHTHIRIVVRVIIAKLNWEQFQLLEQSKFKSKSKSSRVLGNVKLFIWQTHHTQPFPLPLSLPLTLTIWTKMILISHKLEMNS